MHVGLVHVHRPGTKVLLKKETVLTYSTTLEGRLANGSFFFLSIFWVFVCVCHSFTHEHT